MNKHLNPGKSPSEILIVDDSPTQAKLLELILSGEGYHVSVAQNGREAINLIAVNRPDLVVSDILMPEMDGFELCRRIRKTEEIKSLPIILLTSLSDPAEVLRSLEAGANYFLSKPCDNKALVSLVRQALLSKGQSRTGGDNGEVKVHYHGQTFSIGSNKDQIVDLLLTTYETAVDKNRELLNTKNELRTLNEKLERRVEERTAELREKDQLLLLQSRQAALGEMIGNIAHQWRQPLNVLGLTIQQLPMFHDFGELTSEFLNQKVNSSMELILHMSQTIDDFRNYFRPDKEKVEFKVSEAIENTLSLLEGSLQNPQITVDIVTKDDPVIYGYRNEFAQVLLNILNNARDALIERETDDRRVTITIFTEGSRSVVTVADSAGGVPEGIMGKIFDPYFTTKGPQLGTGVGLFMSKTIIEKNMGGRLSVRNTADGAEFRIEV
ncbi:MAG TPA: response regulator [Geobacteraceae bacterium]|nr:response regulator [Geobacteraceae bacterium]